MSEDKDIINAEENISENNEIQIPQETDNTDASPVEVMEVGLSMEIIPSMDEFKDEIARSFKKINEGDIMKGTVIGINESEVILDLGYYTEGIIKLEELSNDPGFSIKADVKMGEEITATVLSEDDGNGNILLSRKRADDILAWARLKEAMLPENVSILPIGLS
jgi:small subunit ribosomal protein S1